MYLQRSVVNSSMSLIHICYYVFNFTSWYRTDVQNIAIYNTWKVLIITLSNEFMNITQPLLSFSSPIT